MAGTKNEKQPYAEPVLEKRDQLARITEAGLITVSDPNE